MRTVGLTLLAQYLLNPPPEHAQRPDVQRAHSHLRVRIAQLRSPYFSDWIALLKSLTKRADLFGLDLMPGFAEAMASVKSDRIQVPQDHYLRNDAQAPRHQRLDLWDAFLTLRNHSAHSGQKADHVCRSDLAAYRPALDRLLGYFGFLADYWLVAIDADLGSADIDPSAVPVRVLRGAGEPALQTVDVRSDDAFRTALARSPTVMCAPDGRVQSLYPLVHAHLADEPLHLLDGYDFKDTDNAIGRRTIYYLGDNRRVPLDDGETETVHQRLRRAIPHAGQRLRELLDAHEVQWRITRTELAPWTIRDTVNDYSRRTVADLLGTKYLPEVYLDRPSLSGALWRLVTAPETPRAPGAMLITGGAGHGKSALLCDLTRRLLDDADSSQSDGTEGGGHGHDLVLLLRGDTVSADLPGSNLLLANFRQKIGLAANDAGLADFQSMLAALDHRRREDRVPDRRLVVMLDGLNEAPEPRARLAEALELVRITRDHPWLRVVIALREEFLTVWSDRTGGTQANLFEGLRDCFVAPPTDIAQVRGPAARLPAWHVPAFSESEAEIVYGRYQDTPRAPAWLTPWSRLQPATREHLLRSPLYLHLWMEAFDRREAPPIAGDDDLFRVYLESYYARFPRLAPSLAAVLDHLLATGRSEPNDADVYELVDAWEHKHTREQRRLRDNPVETALAAGLLVRRTGVGVAQRQGRDRSGRGRVRAHSEALPAMSLHALSIYPTLSNRPNPCNMLTNKRFTRSWTPYRRA